MLHELQQVISDNKIKLTIYKTGPYSRRVLVDDHLPLQGCHCVISKAGTPLLSGVNGQCNVRPTLKAFTALQHQPFTLFSVTTRRPTKHIPNFTLRHYTYCCAAVLAQNIQI